MSFKTEAEFEAGVKVVTLRKWITSEKIPCRRVGKLWKFKASEVDAWVHSGGAAEDK